MHRAPWTVRVGAGVLVVFAAAACKVPLPLPKREPAVPASELTAQQEVGRHPDLVYAALVAELDLIGAQWLDRDDEARRARAKVVDARVQIFVEPRARRACWAGVQWRRYGIDQPEHAQTLLARAIVRVKG